MSTSDKTSTNTLQLAKIEAARRKINAVECEYKKNIGSFRNGKPVSESLVDYSIQFA